MECRLLLVLVLYSVHVIQAKSTTIQPESTPDDDTPVSVFIPLPVSYNFTTQWLGVLRDSYIRIIGYERDQRVGGLKVSAMNIKEMSQSYRREMDELVMSSADKDRPCVDKNKELVLQVLSTLEAELQACAKPLESMTSEYDQQLDDVTKRVSAQDEADIYTPCLPSRPLTRSILARAKKCFDARYKQSVELFYYPTGQELFRTVTETKLRVDAAQTSADRCAGAMVNQHDRMLTEKLEGLRQCGMTVAVSNDAHHSRSRRGFGKKFKKAWKKVKKGFKKLCSKIPCKVGYSVALPGR